MRPSAGSTAASLADRQRPHELALGTAFLDRQPPPADGLPPLAQLAQVLMLTNEFSFVD